MSGNQFDLLVIGEGLSGITAAGVAASQGQRVMLASSGPGTFVLGTACIDLDGFNPSTWPVDDRAGAMEEAVQFFTQLSASAGCAYHGGMQERHLVPTIMGTFQTVSLAPQSLWQGDPASATKVVVAGIDGLSAVDSNFVAERLACYSRKLGLNTSYRTVTVRLPGDHPHALTTIEVATRFDREQAFREGLLSSLRSVVEDAELLILPGVLGMRSTDDELRRWEATIGCAICELATMPPSVPGLRLVQRFESHLQSLGVEFCSGFQVQRLCFEGDWCTGVALDTPGRPRVIHAESVVLASGRFSHLLAPCGLHTDRLRAMQVNHELRPVRSDGTIIASNLFQCGSALGKCEARHGNALAIVSGFLAGTLASRTGAPYAIR